MTPKSVRKLLTEYAWLDYIPFFRNAKWTKVAELYEDAGDRASIKASIDADYKATIDADRKASIDASMEAGDYYELSAQYFADVGLHYRSAVLRMKAAQQYALSNYLDKSNMQYLNAADIFKDISKPDCYVLCIAQIAKNFWAMDEYECAVKHYEICIKNNMLLGKPMANEEYLDCLGTLWSVCMGKYNLAITVYERLVQMTGHHRYMYILGLLYILTGSCNNINTFNSTSFHNSFLSSYYGEYLILLANDPKKAVTMYEVYKDFVGQCDLLDILHRKISSS
jgi:tetratricopeptide (TPR) repeat protein